MIQANELRQNNYVYDVDGDILQIDEISNDYVKFKNTSLRNRLFKIKPIELTEEILSKIKGSITRVNPLETEIDLGLLYWFSSVPKSVFIATNGFKDIEISCEFLHQLQNLYWCLTNEELNVKL